MQLYSSPAPGFFGDLWQRMREKLGGAKEPEAVIVVRTPKRVKAKFQSAIVVPVCPACRKALRPGPSIPCTSEQPHNTHTRCASLMHGKCATCGFPLRGYENSGS